MKYFKKIEGKNLYLSPISEEDVIKYTEWMNDFKVTDGINMSTKLIDIKSEKEWFNNNKDMVFAIVKNNDELIGNISLNKINNLDRTAEIGICIGNESNRGKGYGSEALSLIIKYAFDYHNLNNIMLRVYSFNKQAIKCYEKVGFKVFGVRNNCHFCKGEYCDEIYMQIINEFRKE